MTQNLCWLKTVNTLTFFLNNDNMILNDLECSSDKILYCFFESKIMQIKHTLVNWLNNVLVLFKLQIFILLHNELVSNLDQNLFYCVQNN